jgi:hypothetical protein
LLDLSNDFLYRLSLNGFVRLDRLDRYDRNLVLNLKGQGSKLKAEALFR